MAEARRERVTGGEGLVAVVGGSIRWSVIVEEEKLGSWTFVKVSDEPLWMRGRGVVDDFYRYEFRYSFFIR